jgi:hypothetical protein
MTESSVNGTRYRIIVRGRLSDRFAAAFEGMRAEAGEGRTALVGDLADQSELFGVLDRVHDLGLELLAVEKVCR